MGIGERFRQKTESQNTLSKIETSNLNAIIQDKDTAQMIQNLKDKTLNKIYKTPHWQDYTDNAKINMVSKYFDAKIKGKTVKLNNNDKNNFINGVLAAVS